MSPRQDLLSRSEAAAYLGVSPSWLSNHTKDGPTVTRMGRKVYYLLADLEAYVQAQRGKPASAVRPRQPTFNAARSDSPITRIIESPVLNQLLQTSRDGTGATSYGSSKSKTSTSLLTRDATSTNLPVIGVSISRVTPPRLPAGTHKAPLPPPLPKRRA